VAVGTERSVAAGVMRGGARSIRKLKGEVQMEKWSCVTGFGSHNAVETGQTGRVEVWRGGLGRSRFLLLARPFVCRCLTIARPQID
jgi:hypothetical protein